MPGDNDMCVTFGLERKFRHDVFLSSLNRIWLRIWNDVWIQVWFDLLSSTPSRLRPDQAGRSFFPKLFGAWQATDPWRRYPRWRDGGVCVRHRSVERSIPHLRAL